MREEDEETKSVDVVVVVVGVCLWVWTNERNTFEARVESSVRVSLLCVKCCRLCRRAISGNGADNLVSVPQCDAAAQKATRVCHNRGQGRVLMTGNCDSSPFCRFFEQ